MSTRRDVLEDIADLENLRSQPQTLRLRLHRPESQVSTRMHLKVTKLGEPVPISDLLPMLENFGLRVIAERPYELSWPEGGSAWIQDFELEHRDRMQIDIGGVEIAFRDALSATWAGEVENDGFNRLLLSAGLLVREIVILRAYCRYLLQTGVPFSQVYMERTLGANPTLARQLVKLFEARFDPELARTARSNADKLIAQIRVGLDAVTSLDEDRILRAYLTLVEATLRTNFYQLDAAGKPKGVSVVQARPGADPRPAAAPPKIRDLRLQPARGSGASAHGVRGARRHPLVRPARGLPHGGPGADEGPERQEHPHRPCRGQGRLCRQAPAGRSTGRDPGRSHRLLPHVHAADCWTSRTTSRPGA